MEKSEIIKTVVKNERKLSFWLIKQNCKFFTWETKTKETLFPIKLLLLTIELKIENKTIPENNSEKKSRKIHSCFVSVVVVVVYHCQSWYWCWWCWWCWWWCSRVMWGWPPPPDSGRGTVPRLVSCPSAVEAAHYGK